MDLSSHPSISDVTVTNNGLNGLLLDQGALTGNTFWDNPAIVYQLSGDVTVPLGDTLTVSPGQIVKSSNNNSLLVNGTLSARGTALQPVVFDVVSRRCQRRRHQQRWRQRGSPGDRDKIHFNSTSTANVLNYVQVLFAGGGDEAGAVVDNGTADHGQLYRQQHLLCIGLA